MSVVGDHRTSAWRVATPRTVEEEQQRSGEDEQDTHQQEILITPREP
jgi:hypothetical protein